MRIRRVDKNKVYFYIRHSDGRLLGGMTQGKVKTRSLPLWRRQADFSLALRFSSEQVARDFIEDRMIEDACVVDGFGEVVA